MLIDYDGGPFNGWQRQAAGQLTVQGAIEAALARLEEGPHTIAAAGRWGSKQRELACARLHGLPSMCRTKKKPAPRRAAGVGGWDQAATSCRASASACSSLVSPPLERNVALRNRTLTFFNGPLWMT